jgi:hypothetical protein
MAKKPTKSLSAAVSAEIQSKFDLNKFKNKKGLDKNIKFKDQEWIPLSPAFQEVYFNSWDPNGAYCNA